MNHAKNILFSCLSFSLGALLTLAFAPYHLFPIAIASMSGLLALWLHATPRPRRAAWYGFLFGLGLFGFGVYWIFISIHNIAGVPIPLAACVTGAFISVLALFPASVGYALTRYFPINTSAKICFAFPALWLISELFRGVLFTGFPWLFLGYSQSNSVLKNYAPLFGVYASSFAVLFSAALIVNLYLSRKRIAACCAQIASFVAIWIIGALLSLIAWTQPMGHPLSVALVQGNIPQSLKWSPENLQLSFDRYQTLTEPLWGKAQLIIWPEAALPLPLQNAAPFIQEMDQRAKETKTALLLGIPIKAKQPHAFYNAVISLGKDKQVYLKRQLVPFGEYIPHIPYLYKMLDFMHIPMSDTVPGKLDQAPLVIDNIKILTAICYEIAFPQLMRTLDGSVNVVLTLIDDAWFGDSNARAQHLQIAELRALELGRPVIAATNDGLTAIINPQGNIVAIAPQREVFVS